MPFHRESVIKLRMLLGITQEQLGRKLGCTGQTVWNWEQGKSFPALKLLDALYALCEREADLEVLEFWGPPGKAGDSTNRTEADDGPQFKIRAGEGDRPGRRGRFGVGVWWWAVGIAVGITVLVVLQLFRVAGVEASDRNAARDELLASTLELEASDQAEYAADRLKDRPAAGEEEASVALARRFLRMRLAYKLNRDEAEQAARELTEDEGTAWLGHAMLAKIFERQQHAESAAREKALSEQAAPSADEEAFKDYLLYTALLGNDLEKRIAALGDLLAIDPGNRAALYIRCRAHLGLVVRLPFDEERSGHHVGRALADSEELVERFPNWSHSWSLLGKCMPWKNDYRRAVRCFTRAIELEPTAALHMHRGDALRHIGDFYGAVEASRAALNLARTTQITASIRVGMGKAYRDLGQYEKALEHYDLALTGYDSAFRGRERPDRKDKVESGYLAELSSFAYRGRGVVHLLLGATSEAKRDFQRSWTCAKTWDRAGDACYASLFLWQVHQLEGDSVGAAIAISNAAPFQLDAGPWVRLLVDYYAGQIDEAAIFVEISKEPNAETQRWMRCEASYYIGEKTLRESEPDKAKYWFEECLKTGITYFNESHLAQERLSALGGRQVVQWGQESSQGEAT